jgi:uncharacterized FlaG/YvyC family protein
MILKKIGLLTTLIFLAFGMTACQEQTASQEAHEDMQEAVDDFTTDVNEITEEDGTRKEMKEAVDDFTDDIDEVTEDLNEDIKEAG